MNWIDSISLLTPASYDNRFTLRGMRPLGYQMYFDSEVAQATYDPA
jgi:hypothetical protein